MALLRLSNIGGRFARVTIETDEDTNIHAASARWFGDGDPLLRPEWRVTQAKLRITFHPEANGKREKSINVELRAPNGSNLKDQTQRHQLVSEKYLLRWGKSFAGIWRLPHDCLGRPNRHSLRTH